MRWRGPARPAGRGSVYAVLMLAAALAVGCGDESPTAPTAPAPAALDLACPTSVSTEATSAGGTPVSFAVPTPTGGRAPVTVTCSATSGQTFPVGTTTVTCTARDVANQLAACAFDIRVTPAPRLSRSRFLAFGDSITAGEVTAPGAWGGQIVLPSASYPTVLGQRLTRSYPLQAITVLNAGQPGQPAATAVSRFTSLVQSAQPEVVLLLIGYNDIDTPSTVAAAANALTTMAREGRVRGARVFLGTLTPSIQGRLRSLDPGLIDTLNIRIRQIAVTENAVLVDLHQGLLPSVGAWIGVDGLHPNEAGYARMADLFYDAIRLDLEVR